MPALPGFAIAPRLMIPHKSQEHTQTPSPAAALAFLTLAALTLASFSVSLSASPKIPAADGEWPSVPWLDSKQASTDAPGDGDDVFIANNKAVTYKTGMRMLRNVEIGTNGSDYPWLTRENASGVLSVAGGNLNIAGPRFYMGTIEGAKAVLNIEGGVVSHTNTTSSGYLGIGMEPKTVSFVKITSGRLAVNALRMGVGDGATATMQITGGEFEAACLGASNNCYVPRPLKNAKNAAYFEQTGGKVSIQNNKFFFIGTSSDPTHNVRGVVKITGGSFMGRICVGGRGGEGEGQLIVGPAANISMYQPATSASLVLRKTGSLVFLLGATPDFNPINLKKSSKKAINVEQAGATIIIDGAALPYKKNTPPITLIEYKKGTGPSDADKTNLEIKQSGFAKGFEPALAWADDKLVLYPHGLPKQ